MGAARFAAVTAARRTANPEMFELLCTERARHAQQVTELKEKCTVEVTTLRGQLASAHTEHARQVIALNEKFEAVAATWQRELASAQEELARAQAEIKDLRAVNEGHACKLKTYEGVILFIDHIAAATREVR
jgi:hypothetical protein